MLLSRQTGDLFVWWRDISNITSSKGVCLVIKEKEGVTNYLVAENVDG